MKSFMNCVNYVVFTVWFSVPINLMGQVDSLQYHFDKARTFQSERDHERAVVIFQDAIKRFLPLSSNDTLNALTYHRLGISYYILKERRPAIESWDKAIALRNNFLPSQHIDIVKTHINIANAYLTLNEYKQSSASLHKALDLLNTQPDKDHHNLSRVYESLGLIARLTEDFQSSQDFLLQSYSLKRELHGVKSGHLINITTRLFDVYKDLEDKSNMLNFAQKSLEYALQASNVSDQYYYDLANAYNNLGIAHSSYRNTNEAIEYFETSIDINFQLQGREEFLAFTYNNLISQYNIIGDFTKALNYSDRAKAIFKSDPYSSIYLAETLIEEGDVHYAIGDFQKAAEVYQEAIRTKVIDAEMEGLYENPNTESIVLGKRTTLMDALYKKSRSFYQTGNFVEAANASNSLLKFVKQIRNQLSDRSSKKYLLESSKKFYELAIDIRYAIYKESKEITNFESALALFDDSKSSILYDAVSQNVITTKDAVLKNLIKKERSFYRVIADQKQIIWESGEDINSLEAKDSILNCRTKITKLRDTINQLIAINIPEHRNQEIYKLDFLQSQFIPKNTAIVQYFIGAERAYVIYIDKAKHHFQLISPSDSLIQLVNPVLQNLKDYLTRPEDFTTSSYDLFALIIKSNLHDNQIEKLIIVPDDILAYLPFETLSINRDPSNDYKSIDYLLRHYSVSYAASMSVLDLQLSKVLTSNKAEFLGMASDYQDFPDSQLSKLTLAVEELEQVNKLMRGDIYINEGATKLQFINVKDKYKNIHLSLHGIVNSNYPSQSYLQFSIYDINIDEGKLYASEIYNQTINTQMVVLSACETGTGTLAKGEGILSLAHAFAYAGAKSTVMSLWQISSQSTAQIMTIFYKDLKNSVSKDQSLRSAKLNYIDQAKARELVHPFYWAGLVQYGDSRPISRESSSLSPWVYCLLALVLMSIGYFSLFRRSFASSV